MNAKRKKLVTIMAIILAVLMVGSMATLTVSLIISAIQESTHDHDEETKKSAEAPYSFDLLAEEAPTFNTTVPSHVLTPEILHKEQGSNGRFTTELMEGYCVITPTSKDPYFFPMAELNMPARYAVIGYRSSTAANTTIQFFMGSTGTAPKDDTTMLETAVVADGEWHAHAFDLQELVDRGVYNGTKSTFFRFDPLEAGYVLNENGEPYKEGDVWVKNPIPDGASIDIRFIAFFETEEQYQGFDMEQYVAKLAYEAEQKRLEEEAKKKYDWATPTFTEMETTEYDKADGTLKMETSADGSTMTISYDVNGETVSYTVPNNYNYTMGGYAATDDLDRTLYTSTDVGGYGTIGEHYVGLFYFLWQGEHGDSGIFDLQKIIDQVGVEAAGSTKCGKYGGVGAMHWFAEPLYGYYYANDQWVHRKHAELLTQANIDFLYFDTTNGYPYLHNAKSIMKCLHELNEQGFDAPQVVFYTNSQPESVIRQVYNDIYKKGLYEDTWFKVNGKPVIIGPMEANIDDFFTMKQNQWPTEQSKINGWPWMDFQWPSRLFRSAYDFDGAAISVSIAQHSGTVAFSDSSLYNNHTNRGRSFWAEKRSNNAILQQRYDEWKADPSLTNQGLNFQAQFDRALSVDAMYILVTGWNEWVAQRQDTKSDRIWFVDTSSMEFSRDSEMMRGGYFDNYYIQLAYNVQKAKGAAPIVVQDARTPINVTGEFDQWDAVSFTYHDAVGDTADRDATGFGRTHYENTTGRNDIKAAKVASDSKNVYFYVECAEPIPMYDNETSWMKLYVDADSNGTTGWYGYDFIVNYNVKDELTTTVAKYNGTDNAYSFEVVGDVPFRVKGNQMMIAVPQELLGMNGYRELCFQFKWADSDTVYDEMEDFYCDGDAAPLGRMNYVYQNYIPGVTNVTYPELETTAPETEAPTEPETQAPATEAPTDAPATEAPTEPETQPAEKKGCGSVISLVSVALIALVSSAVIIKRKEQ